MLKPASTTQGHGNCASCARIGVLRGSKPT